MIFKAYTVPVSIFFALTTYYHDNMIFKEHHCQQDVPSRIKIDSINKVPFMILRAELHTSMQQQCKLRIRGDKGNRERKTKSI